MEGAAFEIVLEPREDIGPAGAERVDFLLAANPGVPATPLRETASGGELSRVMLALMTAAGAGAAGTLVFDEVDSGVGGQTAQGGRGAPARARGRAPGALHHPPAPDRGAGRAPLPDREVAQAGDLATASVEQLPEPAVVEELCRMLGADADDRGARKHAEELLAAA